MAQDSNKQFDWVEFYQEFADKLLPYKNNRQEMIAKVRQMFDLTGINMPLLETDNQIVDMDPFTVFGLFNKGLTDANRIAILRAFKNLFNIDAAVPTTFDGIPVLNPMKATFYGFSDREENDIPNLWDLFEAALNLEKQDSINNRIIFSKLFDQVRSQKCVRWNITMGLYWIRPYYFLSLDSRNRLFLGNPESFPFPENATVAHLKTVPQAAQYLAIQDACKQALQKGDQPCKSLVELTTAAFSTEHVPEPPAEPGIEPRTRHYWLYAPGRGAEMWEKFHQNGIMALGWDEVGDLTDFTSKSQIAQKMTETYGEESSHKNDSLALWQFCNEIQQGDIILVKRGRKDILGMGTVESEYCYDESRGEYPHYRRVNWTDKGLWKNDSAFAMKTLTDVTRYTEFVEKTTSKVIEDRPELPTKVEKPPILPPAPPEIHPYTPEDFLEDVYMDEASYETLVSLIRKKKNVILQGAPGVGKTYAAKRLAYSMMGEKDAERVMMVQFHQSYSYEDFIMGFRPSEKGFELKHGAFYTFCKKAEEDSDNEYFFIIDEINRGNLSKIFGELFMLIESDKRGVELRLLYANEKFSVPANVYIIGMMNTADRSLALLDYALRRRFAFFEMQPGFETEGFRAYRMALQSERFDKLILCVENLNNAIAADESLGEGFRIGHSYFCNLKEADEQTLSNIVEYELIPLLKEYWFDEPTKVKDWANILRSAIK